MLHICKRIISPGFFYVFFFQILIYRVNSGVKEQKMTQKEKQIVSHIPYLRKHVSYDRDFC